MVDCVNRLFENIRTSIGRTSLSPVLFIWQSVLCLLTFCPGETYCQQFLATSAEFVVAMSLYSQSYPGQPSYGASYTHPSMQSGYPYPYLQPNVPVPAAPSPLGAYHFLDPAGFRREFTARLSELQVNSRPIIQNLSMLAQDYSRFAEIVAQSLEEHIRRVSFILFRHTIKPKCFHIVLPSLLCRLVYHVLR